MPWHGQSGQVFFFSSYLGAQAARTPVVRFLLACLPLLGRSVYCLFAPLPTRPPVVPHHHLSNPHRQPRTFHYHLLDLVHNGHFWKFLQLLFYLASDFRFKLSSMLSYMCMHGCYHPFFGWGVFWL